MYRTLLLTALISSFCISFAQNDTVKKTVDYSFIIQDAPSRLFTMRQVDQSYFSAYRLLARGLYAATTNDRIADILQLGLQAFFLMPLTHEEGHRSILTANNIGSVSQPYFNEHGAAYVTGVADRTLQDLRDNDLPSYIRLHTAGLESDYRLAVRAEMTGSFGLDDFNNYRWEYWVRKLAILQYYVTGLFKFDFDLKEESDELDRDVVGYDTYGAVRHLFRPAMNFYRYTRYDDLTGDEIKFVKRLGYRSLLNLLNPLLIGKENFSLTESTRLNAGFGYTMSPFGDFIDENIWITWRSFNIGFYARQFQNRTNWFNGFGVSLNEFKPIDRLSLSFCGHFWQQPVNFDFLTPDHFTGGAIDMDARYFFLNRKNSPAWGFSIDAGLIYKTKGFLPEELYLGEHVGFRIGTTVRL
jgi:hypothetical protein